MSRVREALVLVSAMHISASVFVNDHSQASGRISSMAGGDDRPWDPPRYRHNETARTTPPHT